MLDMSRLDPRNDIGLKIGDQSRGVRKATISAIA
jgi:hypothetical protein